MCCLDYHERPYKCCCGFPIVVAVGALTAYELYKLYSFSMNGYVPFIVAAVLVLVMCIATFIKRESYMVRRALLWTYNIVSASWLIWLIVNATSGGDLIDVFCQKLNE